MTSDTYFVEVRFVKFYRKKTEALLAAGEDVSDLLMRLGHLKDGEEARCGSALHSVSRNPEAQEVLLLALIYRRPSARLMKGAPLMDARI